MSRRIITRRARLYLIGAAILITGWLSAAALYTTAADETNDAVGYEFVDGVAYPIRANDTKAYRHDLERFGGKAAVMADDFNRWLTGWWTPGNLAYGLAMLATAGTLACWRAAYRLPPDDPPR